jgi:oxidoreductase
LRLAFIGLGWVFTDVWAPMLDRPDFRVVAVYDPAEAAVETAVATFPDARVLSTVDDLEPSEVDLAVVATPNHLHASIGAELLRRGINVFIEKPVCLSSAEAALLAEAEKEGGSRVQAGTAAYHRADVRALREQLPRVGPVRTVELSWVRAKGVPAEGGWFTSEQAAGGGALFDLGWHLITVGMRMLGWPGVWDVVSSVSSDFLHREGFGASWHRRGGGGGPANVEDTVHASWRTRTGVFFTLNTAWASHIERDRTTIVVEGADGRIELEGTFGFSPQRAAKSTLLVRSAGQTEEIDVPDEPVGAEYRRQLEMLPMLLADPGQPGAATGESARIVDLIERIYHAAGATRPRLAG